MRVTLSTSPSARVVIVLPLLAATLTTAAFGQSESPSYRLQAVTLNAAGAPGVSATKRGNGSLGQALVVGVSSSPHFIAQSGFWSFLGSTIVPVVLAADKVPAQTGEVALTWSGNNAAYDLYRTTNCATVFSSVFASTSNNAYADVAAPTSGLACYNVLAVAPGPSPPRAAEPVP